MIDNINSLHNSLGENEHNKSILEKKISSDKQLLEKMQANLNKDLKKLKELQIIESNLKKEIANKLKIKQTLNLDSMKGMLKKAKPVISNITTTTFLKAKNVKAYIESNIDKKLIEQKYNEYKQIAAEKGTAIKSKKEFQKIVFSLNNVKGEIKELNLYDIFNKVSGDAEQARHGFKKAVKKIKIEDKIGSMIGKNDKISEEDAKIKMAIFIEWATHKSVTLNDTTENLYDNYLEYVSKKHSKLNLEKSSYSKKSGSFKKALTQYKQSIK